MRLPTLTNILGQMASAGEEDYQRWNAGDEATGTAPSSLEVSVTPEGKVSFGIYEHDSANGGRCAVVQGHCRQDGDSSSFIIDHESRAAYEVFAEAARSFSL